MLFYSIQIRARFNCSNQCLPSIWLLKHEIPQIHLPEILHDQKNVRLILVASNQPNDVRMMNIEQIDDFIFDVAQFGLGKFLLVVPIVDLDRDFLIGSLMCAEPHLRVGTHPWKFIS